MNNGRVNLLGPPSAGGNGTALGTVIANGNQTRAGAFPGFGHQDTSEVQFQQDMLRGNWEQNELSTGFFSKKNLDAIQRGIRKAVYERSQPKGYIIDDQSVDELKMIMRGMFYQYAKNQPNNIQGQIEELNQRVLSWSVPHILSAVDHYMYYLKDIDTLPVPMSHPMHLSSAGTRTKTLNPFM
jgi:hypothetical protein